MAASSGALVNLTPPGPVPDDEATEAKKDTGDAHYRDPTMVCGACEYFQEPSTCTKDANHGQPVEPEGGCDWFENVSDDDQAATPGNEQPQPTGDQQ